MSRPCEVCDLTTPPKSFGTIPWWIWNGRMDYGQMRRQLALMKDAGLEAWMLWARFGLEIRYLSHEFMTKFRFAVEESARLGLDVWIYDEYAWPTGNARNQVQEVNPEYRMRVLSAFSYDVQGASEHTFTPDWGESGFVTDPSGKQIPISQYLFPTTDPEGNRRYFAPCIERVIAVPVDAGRPQIERSRDISEGIDDLAVRWRSPGGAWRVLVLLSRDFGSLIDHLNPDAVRTFIDLVHEKYKRYVGEFFGTTIKGFFSDETRMFRDTQHRFAEPTIAWTKNLFARLIAAGIDNVDRAMAAVFLSGDENAVLAERARFWRTMTDFYADAFYQQITGWAERHGLVYTGDCFSEDSSTIAYLGDYFKCAACYHMPGLDSLMLPNFDHHELYKSPKFASSAARMHGENTRCLAEGPGLLGWGTTMEELRRVTDWLYVFGVNALVPNALMYTVAHEQLYETPSYFFQWTLWPFYGDWDRYVRRLGFALTRGRHATSVALLYPTDSALAEFEPVRPIAGVTTGPLLRLVTDVAYGLLRRQIDFDYVSPAFLEATDVARGKITVGDCPVNVIVLAGHRVVSRRTAEKLAAFARAGGAVVWVGELDLAYDDGADAAGLLAQLRSSPRWVHVAAFTDQDDLENRLEQAVTSLIPLPVLVESHQRTRYAIHRRIIGNDEYLFVVYFGDQSDRPKLRVTGWRGFERADLLTGEWYTVADDQLEFPPYGSLLLRKASPGVRAGHGSELILESDWEVELLDHNVFVPPAVRVSTDWLRRQAWEAFLRYGFEFDVGATKPIDTCWLVLDEVDYFVEWGRLHVIVNDADAPVGPSPVLDPTLVAADFACPLAAGTNHVRIEYDHSDYDSQSLLMVKRRSPAPCARPRLFGRFLVRNGALAPMPPRLTLDRPTNLADRGLALYSGRAVYRRSFTLAAPTELAAIVFDDLAHHAVVRLDDREVGRALWQPWRIDTRLTLPAGDHRIEIEVTNTQANQMFEDPRPFGLLGPVRLVLG